MAKKSRDQYRRHTCGCLTIERDGRPFGWSKECPEAMALFRKLVDSPDANRALCPERDDLYAHADATAV